MGIFIEIYLPFEVIIGAEDLVGDNSGVGGGEAS